MIVKLYNTKFILILLSIIFQCISCFADNYNLPDYKHPLFDRFTTRTLPKLNDFSSVHLSSFADHKSILYPFGGPDVIYPIVLFPNAETYTLIGLEKTGKNLDNLSTISKQALDKSLESLLRRSFFVTYDMSHDISVEYGVLPMLIAQLNMLSGKIKDLKYLDFDFGNSIEITFSYLGTDRKLIYLKSNLQNEYLKNGLLEYIRDNNLLDICLLKAGSYNLHKKEFSKIRDFLINGSNVVLQDDTGIPVNELSKDFSIKLFGNYAAPYGKEWSGYRQKELIDMYNLNGSVDKITFCYGYGCGKIVPAIILAEKKRPS